MNKNKKQIVYEREKHVSVLRRNRQLHKVNILILSIGLALSYIGYEGIGEPILWLGIITFAYTTVTSFNARKQLKM
ncbi:hypothetical protein [Methanolobus sp. WCC4]|uniref:hypothetical protein n=1 Tax=Methanolobus sp. WCC4 TaxID=3125784 RepID=UPI0030F98D10